MRKLLVELLLGPLDHVNSTHFHCSPLPTRPKDIDKRHVILNLSNPYGASVHDNVDKLHFDDRRFTLRLPSIDDFVKDILSTDNLVIFKIDMARAFQMISDAIAFIMRDMRCKVHPYIGDYVVVAPTYEAQGQFDSLASLLQELGLSMNIDKKTLPSEVIFVSYAFY